MLRAQRRLPSRPMRVGRRVEFGVLGACMLAASLAACSSSSGHSAASPNASTTTRPPTTAPKRAPAIAWARLRNPILTSPDHTVKDAALVAANGTWFAVFSAVDRQGSWRIGIEHSTDLRSWSPITFMAHDPSVEGEASPDVTASPDGNFTVTYQSFVHDRRGGLAKLYARTSRDFVHFSPPQMLVQPLFGAPNDRLIDAALARTPAGLLLGFKTGSDTQAFEIARSASGTLRGPWQLVGKPNIRVFGDTIENYQFISINGRWKLLATSNQLDRPFVFDLVGNATSPRGWLQWSAGRQLDVPKESWSSGTGISGSTYEHANSAYLVDHRSRDGHFYLLYEESLEKTTYGGEGHGVLAIARSTDLVHWSIPPG
jgi:hypothetical protein